MRTNKIVKRTTSLFRAGFIPHEGNQHRPHFLRQTSVTVLAYVIVLAFFVSIMQSQLLPSSARFTAEVLPAVLVDLVNGDRTQNGLSGLTFSPTLQLAATLKAQHMANKQYFAHTSPDGISPWHWFGQAGYAFTAAGENLAIDFTDSAAVEVAWMNSPGHRANILNQNFTEIGIAAVNGTYQGHPTVYVVQLFGAPLVPTAVAIAPSAPAPQPQPQPAPVPVPTPIPAPTPSQVAGQEQQLEVIEETDTFVAVKTPVVAPEEDAVPEEAIDFPPPPETTSVAAPNYSSWFRRLLSSPSRLLQSFYIGLATIIFLAILLMIRREMKKHHFVHMAYGGALIVLMFALVNLSKVLLFSEVVVR